jgi:HAD superfamily 5'-nucleotidase-like hydrolase
MTSPAETANGSNGSTETSRTRPDEASGRDSAPIHAELPNAGHDLPNSKPNGAGEIRHEAHQLALPLDEFLVRSAGPGIPRARRVFCNRDLRMSQIAWVGFDMDYTLAIYDQPEMDRLSIEATITKLIARGYPDFIAELPAALDFPVRGLLIDKRYGHILKMDRYKHVCKGFHGFRELSKDEIRALYHSKKIRPATPRYHWIDTLYALSEASLYAALIDVLEKRRHAIDYARAFTDIRECIDEAHRDGTILDAVSSDLPRFVKRDPDLAPTLHKLRSAGKKLFLLTNSRWTYTDKMMTYLLGGAMAEYPSWRNFFDVVVVAATKPAFFQERRPLMEVDGANVKPAVFPLERGKVYQGGNLQDFERALGVSGDQVLYVGDHIYGDILRSKKDSAWRTVMIMQELETEIFAHESCHDDFARVQELEDARERLEDELRFYQGRFKELSRAIGGRGGNAEGEGHPERHSEGAIRVNGDSKRSNGSTPAPLVELESERLRVKRAVDHVRARLRQVEAEIEVRSRKTDARFHPFWGSLLKEGNEQSSFGAQVEEYACLYTSRVSNLFNYSPQQHFRSPRDVMAHEMEQREARGDLPASQRP